MYHTTYEYLQRGTVKYLTPIQKRWNDFAIPTVSRLNTAHFFEPARRQLPLTVSLSIFWRQLKNYRGGYSWNRTVAWGASKGPVYFPHDEFLYYNSPELRFISHEHFIRAKRRQFPRWNITTLQYLNKCRRELYHPRWDNSGPSRNWGQSFFKRQQFQT